MNEFNLASVSKAIAGALVTALVAFLSSRGVVLDPEYKEAVNVLIAGLIGFIAVYLAPKNRV